MSNLEVVALIVASLAAASALLNALVSILNAWRDYRGLMIAVEPDPWGRTHAEIADTIDDCRLVLKISNGARTPNTVAQVHCTVDGKEHSFTTDPPDLLRTTIGPFASLQGWLKLPVNQLPPPDKKIEITIIPIRGRRRVFKFTRQEILPEF